MLDNESDFELVDVNSFDDLVEAAKRVYASLDLPDAEQVGGINALILLSAERNHLGRSTPSGHFPLFNTRALGLEYSEDRHSLVNHVLAGRVDLLSVVAMH